SDTRNGYSAGSTDATQERAPAQGTGPPMPGRIQSGQIVAQLPCGISNSIVRLVRPHKSPTGCHPTVFVSSTDTAPHRSSGERPRELMHIKRRLQLKRCRVIREIRRETDGADIETPDDPLERSVPMKGLTFPAVNAGKRPALT